MKPLVAALASFAIAAASGVDAQPRSFEVAVSGFEQAGCTHIPIQVPTLEWFNPDRAVIDTQTHSLTMADTDGRVLGLLYGNGLRIVHVASDGIDGSFFEGLATLRGLALTVAPNGRAVAAVSNNSFTSNGLAVIGPSGALERLIPLPRYTTEIDLAADGCTVYYGHATGIGRFNACTGAALDDFAPMPTGGLFDIQALPDGTVLVASRRRVTLYHHGGTVIRAIAELGAYGFDDDYFPDELAFSPDLETVWIAVMSGCDGDGHLLRVAGEDGRELSRRPLLANNADGVIAGPELSLGLHDNAFRLRLRFVDPRDGVERDAVGVRLTDDSGYFWFFGDSNVEVTAKILDGRAVNGRYWVFLASMTTVQFTVTAEDLRRECVPPCLAVRTYHSPPGQNRNFIDLEAFPAL